MYQLKTNFLFLFVIILAFGCKKQTEEEPTGSDFKKATLLENIGNNSIITGYQNLEIKLTDFEQKYDLFIGDQTPDNFTTASDAWKNVYMQWQKASLYDFGPAMDVLLKSSLGTFPSDTTKILNNIAAGTYNFDQVSNITAQGFPAFDFLFYRNNAISHFSQASYAQYGSDLIDRMQLHVSTVLGAWNSNYLTTFIASTGTESTSAFSMFVNEFVKSYEELKWTKIGIPLGKQSLGVVQPQYIETRFAKISFPLMRENMTAIHRVFKGDKEDGTQGIGFDDYLIALDREALVQSINSEFEQIISLIDNLSGDFETVLNNNPQALETLYTKVHNLTVLLKTDMTSAFGVMITYQDNDGD